MRRLVMTGVATALLTAGAPVASAHPNFHYEGGCQMVAVNDTTPGAQFGGPTIWNGVGTAAVVATRSNGLPAPLAPLVVQCELRINGVPITWWAAAGTGVAVGAVLVAFVATPNDVVEVCHDVWVNGEHHAGCDPSTLIKTVPQPVVDVVDGVLQSVVDPPLCVLLGTLSPGVPPTLVVGPDGDVTVAGALLYDCPPYGSAPNVDRLIPYVLVNP